MFLENHGQWQGCKHRSGQACDFRTIHQPCCSHILLSFSFLFSFEKILPVKDICRSLYFLWCFPPYLTVKAVFFDRFSRARSCYIGRISAHIYVKWPFFPLHTLLHKSFCDTEFLLCKPIVWTSRCGQESQV